MPIYEYICGKCRKKFEIFQKITDKPKTKCPKCQGKAERIISRSSFHLKGTGWFKTTHESKDMNKPSRPKDSAETCGTTSCGSKSSEEKCSSSNLDL